MKPIEYLKAREEHDKTRGDIPTPWQTAIDQAHDAVAWCVACGDAQVQNKGDVCPCCEPETAA